ncbi:helix-turn-helix domain-containing protein [Allofournierella sp.]|uniref:helix-turn-helix domain-containing protein n=1 Tax=Allofournierella sp. TaxID=1940256 RepID=UPI003AF1A4D1
MKERIKQIRSAVGLTQQDFADRLKIKRNTIAKYETGRGEPIDAVVSLICREFGVSEIWLRTGSGEMFEPVSRDEKIAAFIGATMREEDSYKKRFISMLSKLDEKEWALLEKMAQAMADEGK